MEMKMDLVKLLDLYDQRCEEKEPALLDFLNNGNQRFLVVQKPPSDVFFHCNNLPMIWQSNLEYLERSLLMPWTDELPYLEPWIGVGVFAHGFGCEYLWREDYAPDTHYRFHKIEEIRNLEYPDWRKSSVMNTVLECIDFFKEQTDGRIPICPTDTQSPFDTATLILDAVEFFTACYTDEELAFHLMDLVTRLIIEFTQVQIDRIGPELATRPGHNQLSHPSFRGLSISDDNLAVSSPHINEKIAFPYNQLLAEAFNGVAIHSCGRWEHTMKKLHDGQGLTPFQVEMIDLSISSETDPCPNDPAAVREALKGCPFIAKVRPGGLNFEQAFEAVKAVFDPSLRLVVEMNYDPQHAEQNYKIMHDTLADLYAD
jgi:hypothetical protein